MAGGENYTADFPINYVKKSIYHFSAFAFLSLLLSRTHSFSSLGWYDVIDSRIQEQS